MIHFGNFEPDRSIHAVGVSSNILNALPVADGWGPLPSLQTFSSALPAAPRGGFTAITPSGSILTVVGTATNIYSLSSAGVWTSVGSGYSVPTGEDWDFELFGTRIIATQLGNPPQYFDVGVSANFADLPGSPPTARFVNVVGDFVVLSRLLNNASALQWSAINDSTGWTPNDDLSDQQEFADGGEVMGVVAVANGAYVLQRSKIRSMTYQPASGLVFGFDIANEKRGCVAPRSIVVINPQDFVFLSDDGFYRGVNAEPIGAERVNRTFFKTIDLSLLEQVDAVNDPFEKVVWFKFVTPAMENILWGYDWMLNRWFQSDQDITGLGVFTTSAVTLEEVDLLYPGGADSVPISLDSAVFSGGRPAFSGFNASNELGFLDGSALEAVLETNISELTPGYRSYLRGCEVIGDLGADSPSNWDMQVGTTDFYSGDIAWSTAKEANSITGIVPFTSPAGLHRFRVTIDAGADWNHIIGVRPNSVKEGNR